MFEHVGAFILRESSPDSVYVCRLPRQQRRRNEEESGTAHGFWSWVGQGVCGLRTVVPQLGPGAEPLVGVWDEAPRS